MGDLQLIAPNGDYEQWRWSDGKQTRSFTEHQLEVVDYLTEHAATTGEAARALGLNHANLRKTLSRPHVKALMKQRSSEDVVRLGSVAAQILLETLTNGSLSPEKRAELALNVLDRVGHGELVTEQGLRRSPGTSGSVTLNIGLPHKDEHGGGVGVTVEGEGS